jgi:hypothetical protein
MLALRVVQRLRVFLSLPIMPLVPVVPVKQAGKDW